MGVLGVSVYGCVVVKRLNERERDKEKEEGKERQC